MTTNKRYSRILLVTMCVIMCILIAIQIYMTSYVLWGESGIWPRTMSCLALVLEIITLSIFFASSRISSDVGNMVFTDVTGIKNKLAYQDRIIRINEGRDTFSIGVIMFDLNNLKMVNDTLGHEMGDHYIEAFSAILSKVQNERINAYRIGGDEFAVILEQTNAVEVHHILDWMDATIAEYNQKHDIAISYARGYEISTSDHYYLMEELTRRADSQMYQNKQIVKEKLGMGSR